MLDPSGNQPNHLGGGTGALGYVNDRHGLGPRIEKRLRRVLGREFRHPGGQSIPLQELFPVSVFGNHLLTLRSPKMSLLVGRGTWS